MAGSGRNRSDAALALFVVAIVIMLLVPLPTYLLDILLAANICFALLLLLVGLYMPNALAILSFPSLLLLATLFRLGLNVASTRLILSDGDAGKVIEAFGTFLIRGEIVVGGIIFTIITIVNFIVIARGSSRVSEVAARFALDALPGKQMAIDADLRAGNFTADLARQKRDELQQESQLYGAMDGAMKFVQGDAIAGFFIILTNILGGMYLGIASGLTFEEATRIYTTLTIGDGLVTQVPAILISICAGVVVTRVSSGENATLGHDLGEQLFARPGLLIITALISATVPFITGLPFIPFFLTASLLVFIAFTGSRKQLFEPANPLPVPVSGALPAAGSIALLPGSRSAEERFDWTNSVEIHLDARVLYPYYQRNSRTYHMWWGEFKNDVLLKLGILLPDVYVVPDENLRTGRYAVFRQSTELQRGEVVLDAHIVEMNPICAESMGLEVLKEVPHPLTGATVFWSPVSPAFRKVIDAASLRSFDFMEFILFSTGVFLQRHPEEILTITDVQQKIKELNSAYPGILNDVFRQEFISLSRLTELMQAIIRDGMSIRDFRAVIEHLGAYCSHFGASMVQEGDFDVEDILSFIRIQRKRKIVGRSLTGRSTLKVITLSPDVEDVFDSAHFDAHTAIVSVDPDTYERMGRGISGVLSPLYSRGLPPAVVLCRGELRARVVHFLHASGNYVGVITFDELDAGVTVEPLGMWEA